MPVYYSYDNAIFGTQSTVGGSAHNYNFAPANGSTWSWTGSVTGFSVRENDGATVYNGDNTNEQVSPEHQVGGAWEQVITIGGVEYATIWDYTFEITAGDGTVYRVAVIDVDLNNDDDLNDAGEDGYYLVFPDGVPPAGADYTVGNIVENDASTSHTGLGATFVCFAAGTLIETDIGPRPIETLVPGDRVLTHDGGLQSLRWIGARTVLAEGSLAPIRFGPGAIGNDRALMVSPQHRMLVSDWRAEMLFGEAEVLVAAQDLVDGDRICRVPGGSVTYVHMLFDTHQLVWANGVLSESLHPGPMALDAVPEASRAEILSIFPELGRSGGAYGPTVRMCLKAHEAECLNRLAA